jgi:hypothetical protein
VRSLRKSDNISGFVYEEEVADSEVREEGQTEAEQAVEEFVDESNPFFVKKDRSPGPPNSRPAYKDTSDAASDILRRMMERRRSQRPPGS